VNPARAKFSHPSPLERISIVIKSCLNKLNDDDDDDDDVEACLNFETACRMQVVTTPQTTTEFVPKYVVVLTYQRSGSSFFGSIFNLNREAFYAYEPLDGLHSALNGTFAGWNVPSDITNYANGSARCEMLYVVMRELVYLTIASYIGVQFGSGTKNKNLSYCCDNIVRCKSD